MTGTRDRRILAARRREQGLAELKGEEAAIAARAGAFLGALPGAARARLIGAATLASVARGESVFREGDPGERALVVLSGTFRISVISRSGKDIVLAYAGAGDIVGEISVLGGGVRTASATAIEPSRILIIYKRDLRALCADDPEVAWALLGYLARRLRRTNELLESGRGSAMGPKLARGLLRLLDEHGVSGRDGERLSIPVSQGDLGAFVNLSRENVNRQLKEWEQDGYVILETGRTCVTDRAALEEIAEFGD